MESGAAESEERCDGADFFGRPRGPGGRGDRVVGGALHGVGTMTEVVDDFVESESNRGGDPDGAVRIENERLREENETLRAVVRRLASQIVASAFEPLSDSASAAPPHSVSCESEIVYE